MRKSRAKSMVLYALQARRGEWLRCDELADEMFLTHIDVRLACGELARLGLAHEAVVDGRPFFGIGVEGVQPPANPTQPAQPAQPETL